MIQAYENKFHLNSLQSMLLEKYFTRKWKWKYVKSELRWIVDKIANDDYIFYEGTPFKVNKQFTLADDNENVFLSFRKAKNMEGVVIIRKFKACSIAAKESNHV